MGFFFDFNKYIFYIYGKPFKHENNIYSEQQARQL